jgi:hypothetical protein
LKFKIHTMAAVVFLALIGALALWCPTSSLAQADFLLFGPGSTFDWSDFRGGASARIFFGRLASLSITKIQEPPAGDITLDLRHFLRDDLQITREVAGVLWIDRLGLRIHAEDRQFTGRHDIISNPSLTNPTNLVPVLDLGTSRFGADLDLVRYPFVRFGINFDIAGSGIQLQDWRKFSRAQDDPGSFVMYQGNIPITIGLHASAIPCRLREVPVYLHARGRFPVPYLHQIVQLVNKQSTLGEAHVVDWEVSGGLRPSVWETSSFAHSTFSLSIEAGFRSVTVDSPLQRIQREFVQGFLPGEIDLQAHWQGAFFQVLACF